MACASPAGMRSLLLAVLALSTAAVAAACVAPADVGDEGLRQGNSEIATCLGSEHCAARCEALVEQASLPVETPVFRQSRCEMAAVVVGDAAEARPAPSCLCVQDDSERGALLISDTGPDSCLLYGRNRQCLYEASAFPGCDLEAPATSCASVCGEVQRRLEVDALRSPVARLRSTPCTETGCHCVLDIDGACYVDDWLDAYDCAQRDDEIIDDFERVMSAGE